jgi:hypothetical protein
MEEGLSDDGAAGSMLVVRLWLELAASLVAVVGELEIFGDDSRRGLLAAATMPLAVVSARATRPEEVLFLRSRPSGCEMPEPRRPSTPEGRAVGREL